VVVNLSEGEPASYKDTVLGLGRPHLVLDGAAVVARSLATREVHVVVPGGRPLVGDALRRAVDERRDRARFTLHEAEDWFVAGQAQAVLQLMSGRPNLPVTAWTPEALRGHRGRPTLLCNAETWAQVGARVLPATASAAPTTLLTWDGEQRPLVSEVLDGSRWAEGLPLGDAPLLVGGYHGAWTTTERLGLLPVDREEMKEAGVPLGAGTVLPLGAGECPVTMTARITAYLASQTAGRCGPCLNGLPALASAVDAVASGVGGVDRVERLRQLVTGRGACAHPDGTARLVGSLVTMFPAEIRAHTRGGCLRADRPLAAMPGER
jgi:NADH:ubiquinone oxidoreductase subunit F (NADH-binding)